MNFDTIEALIQIVRESAVSEVSVRDNGTHINIRSTVKNAPEPSMPSQGALAQLAAELTEAGSVVPTAEQTHLVTAPMVGTFHHATRRIRHGGTVKVGDILGAIEAIKVMNDIPSDAAGDVLQVLVEDGAPVEYGQALFRLSCAQ